MDGVYKRPFVVIEVYLNNQAGNVMQTNTQTHYFIEDTKPNHKEFRIGRSQDNEIMINQQTISRKQCKIQFLEGSWFLMDGDGKKESSNGTWLSLTDHFEKKKQQANSSRLESEPREIEHGTEVKISDSILKIEIFNNGKNSKNYP